MVVSTHYYNASFFRYINTCRRKFCGRIVCLYIVLMKNSNETYKYVLGIVILALIIFHITQNIIFFWIGGAIGLASLLSEYIASFIKSVYWKLITVISKVNGVIITSIIFGILLIPYALILRLIGKKLLDTKDKSLATYFIDQAHSYVPEDLEDPF